MKFFQIYGKIFKHAKQHIEIYGFSDMTFEIVVDGDMHRIKTEIEPVGKNVEYITTIRLFRDNIMLQLNDILQGKALDQIPNYLFDMIIPTEEIMSCIVYQTLSAFKRISEEK